MDPDYNPKAREIILPRDLSYSTCGFKFRMLNKTWCPKRTGESGKATLFTLKVRSDPREKFRRYTRLVMESPDIGAVEPILG
jgi:hypothetical protein